MQTTWHLRHIRRFPLAQKEYDFAPRSRGARGCVGRATALLNWAQAGTMTFGLTPNVKADQHPPEPGVCPRLAPVGEGTSPLASPQLIKRLGKALPSFLLTSHRIWIKLPRDLRARWRLAKTSNFSLRRCEEETRSRHGFVSVPRNSPGHGPYGHRHLLDGIARGERLQAVGDMRWPAARDSDGQSDAWVGAQRHPE